MSFLTQRFRWLLLYDVKRTNCTTAWLISHTTSRDGLALHATRCLFLALSHRHDKYNRIISLFNFENLWELLTSFFNDRAIRSLCIVLPRSLTSVFLIPLPSSNARNTSIRSSNLEKLESAYYFVFLCCKICFYKKQAFCQRFWEQIVLHWKERHSFF